MITSLTISNFKCFAKETIEFRPLTLLTGYNAAGKSTTIQAVLLASETSASEGPYVAVNGPFDLELGRAPDLVGQSTEGGRDITVEIVGDDGKIAQWRFRERENEDLILEIAASVEAALVPWNHLQYLAAERIGPRETHQLASVPRSETRVGSRGEFTAQVLAARELDKVRPALLHRRTEEAGGAVSLLKQVELWLGEFIPDIEVRSVPFADANLAAVRFKKTGVNTEWLRPVNAGFGASYTLPIVVAALLAKEGDLLIVDSPEAHLHPSAQSRMGRFLATVAASGVQVLVETHSDHVLNGVRVAVVDEHPITKDQVVVQFFGGADQPTRCAPIHVDARGGLSHWPKGFFDQSEQDLSAIVSKRS